MCAGVIFVAHMLLSYVWLRAILGDDAMDVTLWQATNAIDERTLQQHTKVMHYQPCTHPSQEQQQRPSRADNTSAEPVSSAADAGDASSDHAACWPYSDHQCNICISGKHTTALAHVTYSTVYSIQCIALCDDRSYAAFLLRSGVLLLVLCVLCYCAAYVSGDAIRVLNCQHHYHKKCKCSSNHKR